MKICTLIVAVALPMSPSESPDHPLPPNNLQPRSPTPESESNKQSKPAIPGSSSSSNSPQGSQILNSAGVELGPIGLSFGSNDAGSSSRESSKSSSADAGPMVSISSLTTEQWRAKYESKDGAVDLWLEDEYNAGSRLVVSVWT